MFGCRSGGLHVLWSMAPLALADVCMLHLTLPEAGRRSADA